MTMVKVKTIITTDGEVDDMNSLIHLCLYLNEINLVGVVYTANITLTEMGFIPLEKSHQIIELLDWPV